MEAGDEFNLAVGDDDGVAISGKVRLFEEELAPGSFVQEVPDALGIAVEEMRVLADAPIEGKTLASQFRAFRRRVTGSGSYHGCYGCSEEDHALRHTMYRTSGSDILTRFLPDPEHFDGQERLDVGVIAAVTDCPNLWVLMAQEEDLGVTLQQEHRKTWITGTHSVHYLRVPERRDEYRTVTRVLNIDGRKGMTACLLMDPEGTPLALAEAVSILIDTPPEMM